LKERQESDALTRIGYVLACVFAIELIAGGPGYWIVGPLSVRKMLFSLNVAWFAFLWAMGKIRLRNSEILLASALTVTMLLWVVLIPLTRHAEQLALAVQDGLPIATCYLAVFYLAFFRRRGELWKSYCTVVASTLASVAVANIALWLLGMSGDAGAVVARAVAQYWLTLGNVDLAPPLYVGSTGDGFFRAMWITGTLYLPALLYCIAARRRVAALIFVVALIATYTRGLWLGAALGIAYAHVLSPKGRPFLDSPILLVAVVVALVTGVGVLIAPLESGNLDLIDLIATRIGGTFSDVSAAERYEQIGPLVDEWVKAPWFGHGFGAHASVIRSEEAVFSYEITGLALLMKLGIVGMIVIGLLLGLPWAVMSVKPGRSGAMCAGLASLVAFLIAATTNPYLTNFVGMSAVSFILLKLYIETSYPDIEKQEHVTIRTEDAGSGGQNGPPSSVKW